MRLLNTNRRLPGGWRYEQYDSAGKLLYRWDKDFDPWPMFLGKIYAFRKANKLVRQEQEFVEADVTEYLAREFGGDPKYFTTEPGQKKTSNTPRFQSRVAKLAARGKQLLSGAAILSDWLGEGAKPVAPELAQDRADRCTGRLTGNPCPYNDSGFKPVESIANLIHAWAEKKNEMALTVIGEENLHTCQVCFCDLKTKTHVPMKTILDRTPQAMLDKFDDVAPKNCWMRLRQ